MGQTQVTGAQYKLNTVTSTGLKLTIQGTQLHMMDTVWDTINYKLCTEQDKRQSVNKLLLMFDPNSYHKLTNDLIKDCITVNW